MPSRLGESHFSPFSVPHKHPKAIDDATFQNLRANDAVLSETICRHRPFDARQQPSYARVIAAYDVSPVKWNLIHERHERFVNGGQIRIIIKVVEVHVGHHVDDGQQTEKRPVGFVRLGDKVFPLPQPCVCAIGIEPAADNHGGVKAGGVKMAAVNDVVVVLPWAPAMAMPVRRRISSASISARG